MDIRFRLFDKRQKQKRSKLSKTIMILVYVCIFVFGGLSFKETYSIYNTLARTPASEAGTVAEILEVEGEFDAKDWLDSGNSGLEITNISTSKVWVYFNIEGELIQAIQHLEPICLEPEESYELPIVPVNTPPLKANGKVNELGLLGWKNSNQEFSGRIIAAVLNGYAGYEVGTVSINGKDIYEHNVKEKNEQKLQNVSDTSELESANSIGEIESVNDILLLIANKIALMKERDELYKQIDQLIEENKELLKENSRLMKRVDSLEGDVDSLHHRLDGARRQIDELQQPPAQEAPPEEDIPTEPQQPEPAPEPGPTPQPEQPEPIPTPEPEPDPVPQPKQPEPEPSPDPEPNPEQNPGDDSEQGTDDEKNDNSSKSEADSAPEAKEEKTTSKESADSAQDTGTEKATDVKQAEE